MWLASAYSPLAIALPQRAAIAVIFCSVGLAISLAGVLAFRRAKTTVNPFTPEVTTVMVTSGIYRFSRNPMYLGVVFALTGWAIYLSHVLAFALLPLFVLYMNRFQIIPEERALSAKFPHLFTAYTHSVRRWL
jgi:protein-S-isoprenylcysteine O-methyltransferase Ste14